MDIPCICPSKDGQTRHEAGDTVTLREKLDFRSAMSTQNAALIVMRDSGDEADILAAMTEKYCLFGVESWSVVDARGKAMEVTRENITTYLLANTAAAALVSDAADDLYHDQVIVPLLARVSTSSQPTPTPVSTSRQNGSQPKHPKQSKPSLTITTLTDDTETTSPSLAGVSKS